MLEIRFFLNGEPATATIAPALPAAPQDEAPQEAPEEIQRLEAWPRFKGSELSEVKRDISRLRKARTEEMGSAARAALIGAGAGLATLRRSPA